MVSIVSSQYTHQGPVAYRGHPPLRGEEAGEVGADWPLHKYRAASWEVLLWKYKQQLFSLCSTERFIDVEKSQSFQIHGNIVHLREKIDGARVPQGPEQDPPLLHRPRHFVDDGSVGVEDPVHVLPVDAADLQAGVEADLSSW